MPYIGAEPNSGLFLELDSLTASATANYTLQLNSANYYPESVNNLLVSINGVIQGSSTMSLNGAVLTVGATLSSADTIDFVRVFGNVGTVSTPTDGSVTANKIGSGAVNLTSKVTGVLPVANGGTGATSFSEANSVIETWYYDSTDRTHANNADLSQTWTRKTNYLTANKNGGMSNSSGIWTFPSTGIWNIAIKFEFYSSAETGYHGVMLKVTSDNSTTYNEVINSNTSTNTNAVHSTVYLPYMLNITDTTNQKFKWSVSAGANIVVRGGTGTNVTLAQFIKLCPSV